MHSEPALGVIGVGNLGGALAEGSVSAGAVSRVMASDISAGRLRELSERIGDRFETCGSAADVAASADIVVGAVKPHILPSVLEEIRAALNRRDVPFVSVAAGVPIERIEAQVGPEVPVIRAMPNLAMLVAESATALCRNGRVRQDQLERVTDVFLAVGSVVHVEESQMHAVTGLTGSGPAYVSLMIEGLAAGAIKKGLQPTLATELACQLLLGSAKLLSEKGLHPAVLRDQVTTPAGTTIAGLAELERRAVRGALMDAVEAATERSEELARS